MNHNCENCVNKDHLRAALDDDALLILTGIHPNDWRVVRWYLWQRLGL